MATDGGRNCVTTSCDYPWRGIQRTRRGVPVAQGQICAAIVLRSGGQSTPSGRECRPGNPPNTSLTTRTEPVSSQLDTSATPKLLIEEPGRHRWPKPSTVSSRTWWPAGCCKPGGQGLFVGARHGYGVRVLGRHESVRDASWLCSVKPASCPVRPFARWTPYTWPQRCPSWTSSSPTTERMTESARQLGLRVFSHA